MYASFMGYQKLLRTSIRVLFCIALVPWWPKLVLFGTLEMVMFSLGQQTIRLVFWLPMDIFATVGMQKIQLEWLLQDVQLFLVPSSSE